jgi:lipopolysaccharide/colanic/teichoic acid biosynthesis glycosyltransferase
MPVEGTHDGLPRAVEIALAMGGLAATSPILLACACAVKVSSEGPVLFRQPRIGRHGKPFTLYKFRTMRTGATGPGVTAGGDPRITRIGKILRKTKLDELPELWNVVKGDLSFVGPRPEVAEYVDLADARWQTVLNVRPGITDPVTLRLRNEEELLKSVAEDCAEFYRRTLLPYKLEGYIEHIRSRSWRSDVKTLAKTALLVMMPSLAKPPTLDEVRRGARDERRPDAPARTEASAA